MLQSSREQPYAALFHEAAIHCISRCGCMVSMVNGRDSGADMHSYSSRSCSYPPHRHLQTLATIYGFTGLARTPAYGVATSHLVTVTIWDIRPSSTEFELWQDFNLCGH